MNAKIDWKRVKTPPASARLKATPPGTVLTADPQRAVRRAELLSLLHLPANARLQFGGREWLQDFDDEACLIVTVPR